MICQNCKSEIREGASFCMQCGKPANYVAPETQEAPVPKEAPVQVAAAPAQPAAPGHQTNPGTYAAPAPAPAVYNNFYALPKQPISVGGWIGRSLIPMIPLVGGIVYFIMLFIWAGDTAKEETFRNWAKAQLIIMAILFGLVILILIISLIVAGSIIDAFDVAF